MKRFATITVAAAGATIAFGAFVAMAYAQVIFVPYFTPTRIEFEGLEDRYPVNGSISFSISLKGYGSNCIQFETQILREDSSLRESEKVVYYDQTQDCRKIDIVQGQYNYTKSFSYSGPTVLGKPGYYEVSVTVFDQITKQEIDQKSAFIVE
jgi:hypothetical protein